MAVDRKEPAEKFEGEKHQVGAGTGLEMLIGIHESLKSIANRLSEAIKVVFSNATLTVAH